jgi:soluble lytic murein transglycosylase
MTSRAASVSRGRRSAAPHRGNRGRRAAIRRRRIGALLVALPVLAILAVVISPLFTQAVKEIALPLRHEDIIRQQAREKGLDPALVAGVIYTESRFSDRTSAAGARGMMQLLPSTAQFIADKSGGTRFTLRDLSTPQVNIAYGTWYLRYLMKKYGENETLAIAAYNGGEANVDRWLVRAAQDGRDLQPSDIPFAETRAYVDRVFSARDRYRKQYKRELGL